MSRLQTAHFFIYSTHISGIITSAISVFLLDNNAK
jgi:hypothetical protein